MTIASKGHCLEKKYYHADKTEVFEGKVTQNRGVPVFCAASIKETVSASNIFQLILRRNV